MLSVNNQPNYSPSFGQLQIAKNPETRAALQKCTQETLTSIQQAGEMLQNTNFLNGIIKKIGDKLTFRVNVPKGFEFPGAIGKQTVIESRISRDPFRQSMSYGTGCAIEKDGDIVTFQTLKNKMCAGGNRTHWEDTIKLEQFKNEEGQIQYRIRPDEYYDMELERYVQPKEDYIYTDEIGDNNQCGALNKILSWADGLMHFDSKIKEVADGKIKLEGSPYTPFPTEAQIAARKVTEQTAKEAKMQQKQETLNDILNKF